jgi:excisionase family DNA binding protein
MGLKEEDRRRLKGNGATVERRLLASSRYTGGPLGYSPQQTADILNSSKSTVYRLLAAQRLRAIKRGASTLITPDSLAEYEASLPLFESRATAQVADAA